MAGKVHSAAGTAAFPAIAAEAGRTARGFVAGKVHSAAGAAAFPVIPALGFSTPTTHAARHVRKTVLWHRAELLIHMHLFTSYMAAHACRVGRAVDRSTENQTAVPMACGSGCAHAAAPHKFATVLVRCRPLHCSACAAWRAFHQLPARCSTLLLPAARLWTVSLLRLRRPDAPVLVALHQLRHDAGAAPRLPLLLPQDHLQGIAIRYASVR